MTTTINYSDKLLKARFYNQFITVPQTTIDYTKLHSAIKDIPSCIYVITKLEQHEDMGMHIHIVVKFKNQIQLKTIHNIITSQVGTITGLIDYQKPKNIQASVNYLKKEETSVHGCPYLEDGDIPKNNGRPMEENTQAILLAIEKAEHGDVEGALDDIKHIDPMKYLQYKQQIKSTLQEEGKKHKVYTPTSFATADVKLSKSQQLVWDLLQQTPKNRRIIWVTGDYGVGKSYLFNYITANHEYGTYNAGSSASMDNVAYGYDREGVIAWDLPRNYDFNQFGDTLASTIEKFSDFSQYITSKKYNGKTQQVLGHAIVFSNHPPLETLKHRDVIHIHLEKDQDPLVSCQPQVEKVQPITLEPLKPIFNFPPERIQPPQANSPSEYEDLRAEQGKIRTPFVTTPPRKFIHPEIKEYPKGTFVTYVRDENNEHIIMQFKTKIEAQEYLQKQKIETKD